MSIDAGVRGRLDIGRVLQRTFEVMGRNFAAFSILGLVLVGVPTMLTGLVEATQVDENGAPALGSGLLLSVFVSVIAGTVLQGALIFATVNDLNGRRPSVGESLATGLRAFLPLLGLGILTGLGVLLGMILLLVPGIMLACAWSVCAQAVVAENCGVFESFERSSDLTRGNRWLIFAVSLVYVLLVVVASVIVQLVSGFAGALGGGPPTLNLGPVFANALLSAVIGVVGSVGVSVLYLELRQAREGASAGRLGEIFS